MNECDPTVRKRRSWFSSLTSTSSYSLSSSVSLTPSPSSQMITNMSDSQVDLDSVYGSMASSSSSSHVAGNFSDSAISQDPDAVYGFIATSSSDSEPRSRTKAVTSTKGNKTSQTNIPVVDSEMECKMATFIEEDLRYHPLTFSNPLRNKSLLTDSHPALATESVVVPVGQPVDSVLSSIPSTNGPAPSLWQRATSLRRSLGKSSRQPLKSNKNKERWVLTFLYVFIVLYLFYATERSFCICLTKLSWFENEPRLMKLSKGPCEWRIDSTRYIPWLPCTCKWVAIFVWFGPSWNFHEWDPRDG